jgi:hypothetical protein
MKTTIATLLIIFLAGCSKDTASKDPIAQLPPATQTGANTFGMVINNTIFVPKSSNNDINNILYPKYNGVLFTIDDKNFTCFISLESKNRTYIFLHVNDDSNLKTKDYNVNGQGTDNIPGRVTIEYVTYKDAVETNAYSVVPNSGTIKLTKNDLEIICGVFSCKLINKKNPNEVLEVKDGRFDFKKATINTIKFP